MIPKILILYKISTYEYLQKSFCPRSKEIDRFYRSHQRHYAALAGIEKFFKQNGIPYDLARRGGRIRFSDYDVFVTIGGDGTFLEAAHHAKRQIVLGINSDPQLSVGKFCSATAENFPALFTTMQRHRATIIFLNRFCLSLDGKQLPLLALNDVLVCHQNPAAMSHYYLQINRHKEEQRSSGVWLSTAAGSTGAIHSAGGRVLPLTSSRIQYLPREIYHGWGKAYRLTGSSLARDAQIEITSLMREGVFFIDGAHQKFPFRFGQKLKITSADQRLRMVKP